MAERRPETLQQFGARMTCRSDIKDRITGFSSNSTNVNDPSSINPPNSSGDSAVRSRISSWQHREVEYSRKSNNNAFSPNYQSGLRVSDSEYGTPESGSLTDQRGRLAGERISNEVFELCEIIAELGERTGEAEWQVTFGQLFEMYTRISNKVVGMLMRARRQKLVHFEGEMLFQGRDNNVIITLLKRPDEIDCVESIRQTVTRK